jgi:DNA-binding transcriptional LysR family regulator
MSGHIKIRDLELVVALCEESNFTQAAKRVGISEPALSKRLRLIERRIQAHLFERSHEGAVITESGRSFVEHARVSIEAFHRAVHEAHEAKAGEQHRLRIGASASLAAHFIELVRSIELRLYRHLVIEIVTEYSGELLLLLQHHQIDLAFVTSPPQIATITTVRVATSPFIIVMRAKHPLAAKESVRLNEVAKYPWVFFNRNVHPPLHDLILQRMENEHQKANIVHHISQADHVTALLTDNTVVAWLTPVGAERVARNGLARVPLLDEQIHLEIHLATLVSNESRLVSEYARSFIKRLEEQSTPSQLQLPIV